jgi:hypothetical protein
VDLLETEPITIRYQNQNIQNGLLEDEPSRKIKNYKKRGEMNKNNSIDMSQHIQRDDSMIDIKIHNSMEDTHNKTINAHPTSIIKRMAVKDYNDQSPIRNPILRNENISLPSISNQRKLS